MKNVLWILLGIAGLIVLVLLTREENIVPYSTTKLDTIDYKAGVPVEESGEVVFPEYIPQSYTRKPSEDFLGKTFPKCLQMVYEWPDGQLYNSEEGSGSIANMEFMVNGRHHQLFFLDGKCVEDNIIK
jgi:hypothetical protein